MEHRSQLLQGVSSSERTQLLNLPSRQFAAAVSFMDAHSPMLSLVVGILLSRSPKQIVQSIIDRVSVEMPSFTFWRAWSTKRLKDQAVNRFREVLVILSQRDLFIGGTSLRHDGRSSSLKYPVPFFPYFPLLIHEIAWEGNARFHNMMLSRRTVYGKAVFALDEA